MGAASGCELIPISATQADALFSPLRAYQLIVLAVSGGADSMALLELAVDWRNRNAHSAPAIIVATVDHGLRSQSAEEAAFVAARCAALGVRHDTLHWLGDKPDAGIPAAARNARYDLLSRHAEAIGGGDCSCAVATAHTMDDQAETLVMRLARGAGVDGLAAMPWRRALDAETRVDLVRPFLPIAKSRLVATLNARGLGWREDATNIDPRYERTRVRATLAHLKTLGCRPAAMATTARRMAEARDALCYADAAFAATLDLSFNNEVFGSLNRRAFAAGPKLLRQRLLARLVARFGGDSAAPQMSEIEAICERLSTEPLVQATLGGAVIAQTHQAVRIWREAGRLAGQPVAVREGARILWDGRFWLEIAFNDVVDVTLRALGEEGRRLRPLFDAAPRCPPAAALATLPGVWIDGTLAAAPPYLPPTLAGFTVKIAAAADADVFLAPYP